MADLRCTFGDGGKDGGSASDRNRGQLVLVAGLALAIVLVVLVLLANTAIYTENLATRENGVGERDALGFRASVVDGVGGIVERENAAEYGSPGTLKTNVTEGIAELDSLLRKSAAHGAASARVNVDAATYSNGSLIRQGGTAADPQQFTNDSGDPDWTVATDLQAGGDGNATRAFVAVVTASSLESASAGDPDDAFHVVVTNGSAVWHAYVYEDGGTIAVAVKPAGESVAATTEICSVSASNAAVDFTGGSLGGLDCPGLAFGGDVAGPYDVLVRNGDRAGGGYNLTVRTEGSGSVSSGDLVAPPAATDPYAVPAVYAVKLPIRYQTSELEYAATVRVAPGEPDD